MSLSPLHQAVLFAAERHRGDDSDLGVPYLCHVLDVLNNLALIGETDADVLTAAALHDVVEHGGTTIEDVRAQFGLRVGGLVSELTRTEPDPATTFNLPSEERYALRSKLLLEDIVRMSAHAKRIKLADRLSNLKVALRVKKERKRDRYLRQTRAILDRIRNVTAVELWNEIDAILTAHSR